MIRSFIGLDLHTTQITTHHITVDENGHTVRQAGRYAIDRLESDFLPLINEQTAVCLEAGTGCHSLARLLLAKGARTFIVDARRLPQIFMTARKTDRIDAKKLADLLKRHLETDDPDDGFPEVFIADVDAQKLRMLVSQYEHLGQEITMTINTLYALFRQWLIHVERSCVIDELDFYMANPRFPPEAVFLAQQIRRRYEALLADKKAVHDMIEKVGVQRFPEQVHLLIGISGISVFGAAVIMSDIITIDRFKSRKKLANHLCSAPRVDSSNTIVRIGHLNKAGRHMSFAILLQAVNHLVHGDRFLTAYAERMAGKPANKIRVTIVAKTITHIFYILKNKQPNRCLNIDTFKGKEGHLNRLLNNATAA
jgi:transposase